LGTPAYCAVCGSPLREGRCPNGHLPSGRATPPAPSDLQARLDRFRTGPGRARAEVLSGAAAGLVAALFVFAVGVSGGVQEFVSLVVFAIAALALAREMHGRGMDYWKVLLADGLFGALYYTIWGNAPLAFHVLEPLVALGAVYWLGRPVIWEFVLRSYLRPRPTPEGLAAAMAELDALVGLSRLKAEMSSLVNEIRVEQEHGSRTGKAFHPTLHMAFVGPPGTGKTTVARLVGRILFELGLLADGHLVEVGRADLVGEYVGQTAPKVRRAVAKAQGGVLFVDEAYALLGSRGGSGADFGREAVDALLRHLENEREQFCCILAGYPDEMQELFRVNAGFASRVPHVLHLDDYTPDELCAITEALGAKDGLSFAPDALPLLRAYYGRYGRGMEGNGRLARHILEAARKERSRRIAASGLEGADLGTITAADVAAALEGQRSDEALAAALAELHGLVGLGQVKQEVEGLLALMREQRDREVADGRAYRPTLHMAFVGPPGTGKTTVARLMGRIYFHLGLLDRPQVVEVDGANLVAEYQGQTARKVQDTVARARGGVLFIDEAYALASSGEFGDQAISALLAPLENDRGKFCCILAGYEREMGELFDKNPGLPRRVPNVIHFTDYSADELVAITCRFAAEAGYDVAEDAVPILREHYARHGRGQGGNGGLARKVFEQAIRAHAVRVAGDAATGTARRTLSGADFVAAVRPRSRAGEVRSAEGLEEALASLDGMIGLDRVKQEIRSLVDLMRFDAAVALRSGRSSRPKTLHVAFLGPPGTGKTTVARLLGQIYFQLGLLADGHLEEVDRTGLIGQYVGTTGPKVEEAVRRAEGGVLFIDEAYAVAEVSSGTAADFGKEAVDTLIKLLDDARDRFCCILAGYEEPMRRFFAVNPGFASRVPTVLHFQDYTPAELVAITRKIAADANFRVAPEAEECLARFYAEHGRGNEGNGRLARNVFDAALVARAGRFAAGGSQDDLLLLTLDDFSAAVERSRERWA
jgi:SpoVK/Ycf46/Vps4 family AAA+-type ATPase